MNKYTPVELVEHDIHPDDTLVFIHIPKAGGITLGALIDPMWEPGSRCPEYMVLPLARLPRSQVATYRSFIGHFNYSALTQLLPAGFKCITMLREPISRHISFLRMIKRLGEAAANGNLLPAFLQIGNPFLTQVFQLASLKGGQEMFKAWREKPLEALVEEEDLQKMYGMVNSQTRQLTPIRLLASRIPDQPGLTDIEIEGTLLESARGNLASMLGFGLLERFQDSIYMLSYLFGWQPIPDTLRLNEAPQRMSPGQLSETTLARLAGYNRLDLALYEYASELFEQRFNRMTMSLLDRYGGKEHAHLEPPLPPAVLENLLEQHYHDRFLHRNPPGSNEADSSCFTFDQAVSSCFGWQRRETSAGNGSFRWTGPGREASIDLVPLAGGDIQLQVGIFNLVKPDVLDECTITVNAEQLPWQELPGTVEKYVLQTIVPRYVIHRSPCLRIAIHLADTFAPNSLEPASQDSRQLGVAVNWIKQSLINPIEEKK